MQRTEKFTVSRRGLLKAGALLGGGAFLAGTMPGISKLVRKVDARTLAPHDVYQLGKPESQLYTVCLQCNTGCAIKVKLLKGVATKIEGNPLSPWTMWPHLPGNTPMEQLAGVEGAICPKGQAGIQSVYDPYRIRAKVLKRAGRRGENKWVSIPFDQAVKEVVEGGLLFKDVPGEENRKVPGLKEVWALRDAKIAKALADDAAKVADHKMTLEEFKAKHKDNLHYLIDPDHPDLGPKNNQFTFAWGRLKGGRSEFIRRFTAALGSTNAHGHTTVCQGSLYFTGKAMSEQYRFDEKAGNYTWTGGNKFYWQADAQNSEFIIFVGASPFEGNYGPTHRVPGITEGLASGRLKMAVIDPRLSKTAAKAWKWLSNKPGTEAAVALALSRWIIENRRYDARFLANANKAAAAADGEPSWANACWLVKIQDGKPTTFLRASEIGLPKEKRKATLSGGKELEYEFDPLVAVKAGQPVPFDPQDSKNAVEGDLFFDGEIRGVKVKTSLQLLYEESSRYSLEEWAKIAGLRARDLAEVAREFTSHGKKAAADIHRGVSQHTNGFYNVGAWYNLNLLIGNFDWKGGMIKASTYDNVGTKAGKPFNTDAWGAKPVTWGISLIRHGVKYEKTTLFKGYPARRPFFPLSSDVYQEIWASVDDPYPYPTKILFLYMGSPVYSLPAGHKVIEALKDPNKLPLFVASDIVVGESSMYADYIFPDLSYLERWEFCGSHPSVAPKVQPVRQPVIAPLTETVKVYGQEQPLALESMLLGMAEQLGLPGFGKDAFGPGRDLMHPDHLYLRQVANVAFGDKADGSDAVPEADEKEVELFVKTRQHLPKHVFDPERWKKIVADERLWRRVVHVLNRGGRFQDADKAYKGELHANPYAAQINMYQEKTALVKDSMTGKNLPGLPSYIPAYQDTLGRSLMGEEKEFPFNLITHRVIQHTKSRTSGNYWVLPLDPDNGVTINKADAAALGLVTGDKVRIVSASNPEGVWDLGPAGKKPMIATVKVVQGMRPGVIGFALGYGHWAYGATDITVDGKVVRGDRRRGQGVHCNAAMRVDPHLKNVSLQDLSGGSVVFYDTRVKLIKV